MKNKELVGNFIILGADGNLGPVWTKAVIESGGKVTGLGLRVSTDAKLTSLFQQFPDMLELVDFDLVSDQFHFLDPLLPKEISGVVLNAGIDSLPGAGHAVIEDFHLEEWKHTFEVNLFGNVNFLNYLLRSDKVKNASIVVVGSMYSQVSPPKDLYSHFNDGEGSVKNPAYAASKAALASVVRQYGTDLASRGIRVNMLSPGGVVGNQDKIFIEKFEDKSPSKKMIQPEILGRHLVYLLSSMSMSLVGQNLLVDDGYSVW